ncbi:MAG TPA: hypothetical protein VK749_15965 [Xanthobacteraceae bacterium]|jgi:hypothetical protein|nr:hypothetical protein [Xanthobacteraceae bacterium]
MSPTLRAKLAEYDSLPDDALVDDAVAATILSISVWTLRRNNTVPARQISERRRGRRVGDLRAKVRGVEPTDKSKKAA